MITRGRRTCRVLSARPPLLVFEAHALRHEIFNVPRCIPCVVVLNECFGRVVLSGLDLDLVVCGQMTFARYMGKKMRYIAKLWSFCTDIALKRNSARKHGCIKREVGHRKVGRHEYGNSSRKVKYKVDGKKALSKRQLKRNDSGVHNSHCC